MATYAVITGGGTAGHVLPALAIAEALVDAGRSPDEIHYVGAQRGIETALLPPTPFPHTFLDVAGLQRELNVANIRLNAAMLPKLAAASRQARALLRRLQPQVVVSVGGYASLPAVFAARRLDVPIVVVSYDRRPGRASQLTARLAAASAVAFPGSALPRAVVTGAPIRRSVLALDRRRDRDAARAELDLPGDRFVLAVTGGSQGSRALNAAVSELVGERAGDASLAVLQVVGDRFLDDVAAVAPRGRRAPPRRRLRRPRRARLRRRRPAGRARGASTVNEVAVTGTPAILVPWAASAEDHQTANVRWLADQGAAVLLAESDLGGLGAVVDGLRADPQRLVELGDRARRAGEVHRRGIIVDVIDRVASGRSRGGPTS